jgi:protein-disulfide isomerase
MSGAGMSNEVKIFVLFAVGTLMLLLGGVFFLSTTSQPQVQSQEALIKEFSHQIASPGAEVTVVEFADFQCPACKAFHPVMKRILSSNPGKVRFIYRHFPLPQHANGTYAAKAAEAAGESGKFWEMYDKLYLNQSAWQELPDPQNAFIGYAQEVGIAKDDFLKAYTSQESSRRVSDDSSDGVSLGVNSTPTIFVNGVKMQNKSFADIERYITELIN